MAETLRPDKLCKEGQTAYQRKDYLGAARAFQAASEGYKIAGDTLTAAEMLNNCSVAFLQAGDASTALKIVQGTELIFSEAGDRKRQALAIGNQAAALDALGRLEEAADAYESSAEILKQVGDIELFTSVMQALSGLRLRQGRQLEALATMQIGLSVIEKPSPKQRLAKKILNSPFKLIS